MEYDLVIFDLDGTLLDTSPGIFGSVRYAEQTLNLTPITDEELREFVGPPPKDMYKKKYNLSDEDAMKATNAHRKYGIEKAIYEAEKYDGMEEVLRELKDRNIKLAVATLKKQNIAEKVLEHFDIKDYFDAIVGMNDEETLTKKMTIEKVIDMTEASKALMVGDSEYDYNGASEAGITFIGVTYGFGFKKGESYSFKIANSISDLEKILKNNNFYIKKRI